VTAATPDRRQPLQPALRRTLSATTLTVAVIVGLAACGDDDDLAERQAEVARRGSEVMPFDLDATTHRFEPTDNGLVQTVTADDPDDDTQAALIREHLSEEAERFARGDFGDPASIHGEDMPGLAELEAGAGDVDIATATVPGGARITYTTDDADLIDALHRWGEAQVLDHGEHAEHGAHDEHGAPPPAHADPIQPPTT
jgi:hypothetical protein